MAGMYGVVVWAEEGSVITANIPQVTLEVPIGTAVQVSGIAQYVQIFYQFAVSAVSIIAATMIMYAGISWLTAAGNSQRIGEAKERVIAAISGLIIAMMSFVILNTINPALTELQNPTIQVSAVPTSISDALTAANLPSVYSSYTSPSSSSSSSSSSTTSSGACSAESDWVDIQSYLDTNNPAAAALFSGNHGSNTGTKAEPNTAAKLGEAYVAAQADGMTIYVNSAARSYADQQRLYNCYVNRASCSADCGHCNPAAKPNCATAPHMSGKALDLTWSPSSGSTTSPHLRLSGLADSDCNGTGNSSCPISTVISDTTANRKLMDESITAFQTMMQKIGFKRICLEWWHFEFNGPSSVVCAPGQY